jgi:hypothetical protein
MFINAVPYDFGFGSARHGQEQKSSYNNRDAVYVNNSRRRPLPHSPALRAYPKYGIDPISLPIGR